jgi:hypothetical protein
MGPSAYQAILGARNRRMRSAPRRAETKIEMKRGSRQLAGVVRREFRGHELEQAGQLLDRIADDESGCDRLCPANGGH